MNESPHPLRRLAEILGVLSALVAVIGLIAVVVGTWLLVLSMMTGMVGGMSAILLGCTFAAGIGLFIASAALRRASVAVEVRLRTASHGFEVKPAPRPALPAGDGEGPKPHGRGGGSCQSPTSLP